LGWFVGAAVAQCVINQSEGEKAMRLHPRFSIALDILCFAVISLAPQGAFSQTPPATRAAKPAPATTLPATPAPSVAQQTKPEDQAAFDALTPYQKSLLERTYNDWAYLAKYRDADQSLPQPAPGESRVVFLGDSITQGWGQPGVPTLPDRPEFFPGKPYVNRGISGQTTPQMLVRFRQDVIDLKPKVVILLAGINDIAENTGKTTQEAIADNFTSMSEIARANGIRVVLCSVLPASDFRWHPGLEPAPKVKALNAWLKNYAVKNNLVYVDYYTPMATAEGGMKPELSPDGVHPNKAGYEIMAPLAEAGISEALKKAN
jgi:acyl-CoA thioesterase I